LRLFGSSWLLSSITTFHAGCASEPLSPKPVSAELPASIRPDPKWTAQAAEDAKQDFTSIPYDGIKPHSLVCDTTLRELPDGSWALFMMAGDDFEPSPKNYIGPTRSCDQRKTWSPLQPVPGRLATFTFIRNHIVTRDGPGHAMNCPDGFVSKDRQWLHFAYDDNRHRAVHYSAKLPPLQRSLLPRKVEVDRDRLAGKIDRLGELGADHPPRRRESVAPLSVEKPEPRAVRAGDCAEPRFGAEPSVADQRDPGRPLPAAVRIRLEGHRSGRDGLPFPGHAALDQGAPALVSAARQCDQADKQGDRRIWHQPAPRSGLRRVHHCTPPRGAASALCPICR
jgi:hypothetical protein